jgi:hypothetical protein
VIGLHRINKSSRLTVVDGLREGVVQEHILHIKLMNQPGARDGQESTVRPVVGLITGLKVSSYLTQGS